MKKETQSYYKIVAMFLDGVLSILMIVFLFNFKAVFPSNFCQDNFLSFIVYETITSR
jgi:hypothetical protein